MYGYALYNCTTSKGGSIHTGRSRKTSRMSFLAWRKRHLFLLHTKVSSGLGTGLPGNVDPFTTMW